MSHKGGDILGKRQSIYLCDETLAIIEKQPDKSKYVREAILFYSTHSERFAEAVRKLEKLADNITVKPAEDKKEKDETYTDYILSGLDDLITQ